MILSIIIVWAVLGTYFAIRAARKVTEAHQQKIKDLPSCDLEELLKQLKEIKKKGPSV